MKSAVIRQVKSMSMSCDRVGNLLLVKFSNQGSSDVCVFVPASIVFWLLKHLPVNQDPAGGACRAGSWRWIGTVRTSRVRPR